MGRGLEGGLRFRGGRLGIQWFRAEGLGSGVQGSSSLPGTFVAVPCRVHRGVMTQVMVIAQRVTEETLRFFLAS